MDSLKPDSRYLTGEDGPLVWIDCEMTGLDHDHDVIIEIAVIITDGQLVPVDEGIEFVISTPKEILDNMNAWCVRVHGASGLTQSCLDSPHSYEYVSEAVLRYVKRWIPAARTGILAGSSVHADARFLSKGMPKLMEHLHYRIVDVSSVKELARRWYPQDVMRAELVKNRGPQSEHRALDDIRASIAELKTYRKNIFLTKEEYQVKNAIQNKDDSDDLLAPKNKSFVDIGLSILESTNTDRLAFGTISFLYIIWEAALCLLAIYYVKYTNIDYHAYTQQAALFLSPVGERKYSKLVGGTGPLVYPALHLYWYSFLHRMFPEASSPSVAGFVPADNTATYTKSRPTVNNLPEELLSNLRPLQFIWMAIYVTTLMLLTSIAWKLRRAKPLWPAYTQTATTTVSFVKNILLGPIPLPAALILSSLNKRLKSIYVLRLFNDPVAMLLLYASVLLFVDRRWKSGSLVYSMALGVKMNILLFLPGLLVLLFQYQGVIHGTICIALIAIVQLGLAAPFLGSPTTGRDYFASAFDFSRSFLYKWSVNWNFVGKDTFESSGFRRLLLIGQFTTIIIFAVTVWSQQVPGGLPVILHRGLGGSWWQAPIPWRASSAYHVVVVLFTSNLIGICFARSLHYQFFSWYGHQLPFLLWASGVPVWLSTVLYLLITNAWDSYPPSRPASLGMFIAHFAILLASGYSHNRYTRRIKPDAVQKTL